MANKIIQIGQTNGYDNNVDSNYSLEVYRDLTMKSKSYKKSYKIDKSINVNAVRGALHNIFTWIPGERILLPEFGSRLYTLLYEGITPQTEEAIASEIRHCVSEWEPRAQIIEIRNVGTIDDTENNIINLEIVFTIVGLDDEQYTYSFTYDKIQ